MRIHLTAVAYVSVVGVMARLSVIEWVALVLCFGLVIGTELMNTAVERLCDLITQEYDGRVGIIKDICASAVLVCAVSTVVVAAIIFFRPHVYMGIYHTVMSHKVLIVILAASIPAALLFVKGSSKWKKPDRQ